MSPFRIRNKKVLVIVAATVALATIIYLWTSLSTQVVPWSIWVKDTLSEASLVREATITSASSDAEIAVHASAARNASAVVHVFVPAQIDCQFPLPLNIPGKGMSKICTYDPKVDVEISGYIKNTKSPYSASDIEIMLEIMQADNKANPHYKKTLEGRSGISLVDVGCNIGLFTLSAALNGYRVLSVDAMNSSLQLLAASLALHNVTSKVTLVHNAISDTHRDVLVQVRSPDNIGASWVLQSTFDATNNTSVVNTQAVVKAICLDDLLPYVPTSRVFLKMDIEGSEWRALRCANRFFSKLDIPYFHMEWAFYSTTQQQGTGIVSFLTSRGYLPFHPQRNRAPLSLAEPTDWPGNVLWKKALNTRT